MPMRQGHLASPGLQCMITRLQQMAICAWCRHRATGLHWCWSPSCLCGLTWPLRSASCYSKARHADIYQSQSHAQCMHFPHSLMRCSCLADGFTPGEGCGLAGASHRIVSMVQEACKPASKVSCQRRERALRLACLASLHCQVLYKQVTPTPYGHPPKKRYTLLVHEPEFPWRTSSTSACCMVVHVLFLQCRCEADKCLFRFNCDQWACLHACC